MNADERRKAESLINHWEKEVDSITQQVEKYKRQLERKNGDDQS